MGKARRRMSVGDKIFQFSYHLLHGWTRFPVLIQIPSFWYSGEWCSIGEFDTCWAEVSGYDMLYILRPEYIRRGFVFNFYSDVWERELGA